MEPNSISVPLRLVTTQSVWLTTVSKYFVLFLAKQYMNDAVGPSGLSLSILVFGTPPTFLVTNINHRAQPEIMGALTCEPQ